MKRINIYQIKRMALRRAVIVVAFIPWYLALVATLIFAETFKATDDLIKAWSNP